MEYSTKAGNPAKTRTQCIIAGIYENNKLSATATVLDKASEGHIRKILKRGDITGKTGQTLLLHDVPNVSSPRVLLIGLGKQGATDAARFSSFGKSAIAQLKKAIDLLEASHRPPTQEEELKITRFELLQAQNLGDPKPQKQSVLDFLT